MYDQTIEIIEWGREALADLPEEDRGRIFDSTYLRGVKTMRMEVHMKV